MKFDMEVGTSFYNYVNLIIQRRFYRLCEIEHREKKAYAKLSSFHHDDEKTYLDELIINEQIQAGLRYLNDCHLADIDYKIIECIYLDNMSNAEFMKQNNITKEELYYRKMRLKRRMLKNTDYNL